MGIGRPSLLAGCLFAVSDAAKGGECAFAGVGEFAGVLLSGGDAAVAETFLDDDDVGAASKQPRGVRGARVVEGDLMIDLRCLDCGRLTRGGVLPRDLHDRASHGDDPCGEVDVARA